MNELFSNFCFTTIQQLTMILKSTMSASYLPKHILRLMDFIEPRKAKRSKKMKNSIFIIKKPDVVVKGSQNLKPEVEAIDPRGKI